MHYLDESLRVHVSKPAPLDDWVTVKLDRWSLAETDSPLYPEDRFQCEVIRRVLSAFPADAEFRVEISEPERWFWWKRNHRTLKTRAELTSNTVANFGEDVCGNASGRTTSPESRNRRWFTTPTETLQIRKKTAQHVMTALEFFDHLI